MIVTGVSAQLSEEAQEICEKFPAHLTFTAGKGNVLEARCSSYIRKQLTIKLRNTITIVKKNALK